MDCLDKKSVKTCCRILSDRKENVQILNSKAGLFHRTIVKKNEQHLQSILWLLILLISFVLFFLCHVMSCRAIWYHLFICRLLRHVGSISWIHQNQIEQNIWKTVVNVIQSVSFNPTCLLFSKWGFQYYNYHYYCYCFYFSLI